MVSAGAVVVRLALVGSRAAGPGVDDGTALFEQALTVVAKPTLLTN